MSRTINREECQPLRTPGQSRPAVAEVTANRPGVQRLCRKFRLATPLECKRPPLIAYPIAGPVVRPDVDEHPHPALEEAADVVLREAEAVKLCSEGGAYNGRAGGEVRWDGGVDTELLADGGSGEVRADMAVISNYNGWPD
jgi:hypothetical protein